MFPVSLVIFREVFEIAIILSIVFAATRGLPGRGKWIGIGFVGGVVGSGIVAFFTDVISEAVEGVGQEIMNAGILLVAAVFIGWTVLWMRRHATDLTAHLKNVGHAVGAGDLSFISLSVVVALTLLREGSEIVLFTYAMLAAGQDSFNIIAGSIIGLVGGVVVGLLIYYGLIKLATKHIFKVTGWLLVFLVAGLASQAARFISAAGYFPELSGIVWDSSWLISDQGILGQTLQILVGYSARPVTIQLIFFAITLGGLITIIKISDRRSRLAVK